MPPKASSSGSSSAGGGRGPPAAAAGRTGAAASAAGASSAPAPQPEPSSQPDSFAAEKLQWALAMPPEQRQPSVQAFIDSCECTTEATRLLAAAPLAQLPGPAKLRALLLLLKAHWSSDGRSPPVPGLDLLPASSGWPVPQQARSNLHELVTKDPSVPHPELQPLYAVAATAAHAMMLSGMATLRCQVASLTNSRAELISHGIHSRQLAEQFEHRAPMSLDDPAGLLEGLVRDIRRLGPLLQHQLAGVVGGVLNVRQMEREILKWLGIVHTWAATPDGAYCGGRIDEQHAAAGQAAFSTALERSAEHCCTAGVLSGLSNLLRRTGAVAEAEAVLRRAVAAARAAGDAFCELNTASALASVIPIREGWSYREMEGLVAAMQRCLQDCKPWIPGAAWSTYRERASQSELLLGNMRRACSGYARQPLPAQVPIQFTNGFVPDRAAKKIGTCSGCGRECLELKFCARCRTAQYCSRACQAQHWRAGHKAECVPVAVRKDGGSRSS